MIRRRVVAPRALALACALAAAGALLAAVGATPATPPPDTAAPLPGRVRGFNILTADTATGLRAVAAAASYGVNHLQVSHETIMDLRHVREPGRLAAARTYLRAAARAGVDELAVWDHALYPLDYYPARFRTGPSGTLDLDSEDLAAWIRDDYRGMLDSLPDLGAVVLTFIETGARAERQHSSTGAYPTAAAKLARVVSLVHEVLRERDLRLYLRTFAYNDAEYERLAACVDLLPPADGSIALMVKETPHDFFLAHPTTRLPARFPDWPVLVEFDAAHEFSGQSVTAAATPRHFARRVRELAGYDNLIGYVLRCDRYGTATVFGTPSEVNVAAVGALWAAPGAPVDSVVRAYAGERFGVAAAADVAEALLLVEEAIRGTYYTLGLNTANHSALDFRYRSIYTRHVAGRWVDPPLTGPRLDSSARLHYWADVVERLAPPRHKTDDPLNRLEIGAALRAGYLTPAEAIDREAVDLVLAEKAWAVERAEAALAALSRARRALAGDDYRALREPTERLWLTARLRRAASGAYYGSRLLAREAAAGTEPDPELRGRVLALRDSTLALARAVRAYRPGPLPTGQYDWRRDAARAERLLAETLALVPGAAGRDVLVLGDSNGAAADGWVVQLARLLPGLRIYNTSIPGNTVGFDNLGRRRLNTLRNVGARLAAARDSLGDVGAVVVALGTNDAKAVFAERQREVVAKVDTLLGVLLAEVDDRVVLVAPPPYGPDGDLLPKYHGGAARVARLAVALDSVALARGLPLADVHEAFASDFADLTRDGVHLTSAGQLRAALYVAEALLRLPNPPSP